MNMISCYRIDEHPSLDDAAGGATVRRGFGYDISGLDDEPRRSFIGSITHSHDDRELFTRLAKDLMHAGV